MKKLLSLCMVVLLSSLFNEISYGQYVIPSDSTIGAGVISGNVSLGFGANTKYLLNGIVKVDAGAVLTVNKGTIIFGSPNSVDAAGGTLVIRRGGKIIADGTVDQPIVFTSSKPAGQRAAGDWGGIIVLGNAINNQGTNVAIEGLTGEFHGGSNDADDSGILRYVRVEFAGFELSPNNEINGLTMGSVGSGTVIENVQVSYSLDDSFEWFGGTVNGKNLVAYRTKDDCFDTDFGFTGKIQNAISFRDPQTADQSKSEAWESDNENATGTPTPRTAPVFSNVTAIGPKRDISDVPVTDFDQNFYYGVHQRRSTRQSIFNSVIMGYNDGGIILDGTDVMTDMRDSVSRFRNNFVDGTARGNTTGTAPSGFVFNTWFDAYNTNYSSALNQVQLKAPFNQNAPGLNPVSGSPLIGAARFTDALLSGFTVVSDAGAFQQDGDKNWDRGWTNYDPQNTLYGIESASNLTDFASSIFLSNGNNEIRHVIIGRNPSATAGLDQTLGETNLPPVPPTSVIDIRCEIPGGTQYSVLDLRPTGSDTLITYTIKFQPGSTSTGKLSWDPNLLGPGTWTIKDAQTEGLVINVNMKTTSFVNISTSTGDVWIQVVPNFTAAFTVATNWNLVSFPGLRANMTPSGLYPDRDGTAQVFRYENGYQQISNLVPGEGYWLKMSMNKSYSYSGTQAVTREPYAGKIGWNIIGSYEYLADVNLIRTAPEGKRTGQVFKYVPGQGYQGVTTLEDGFGFWINLTANADIIIPGSFTPTLSKDENNLISAQWGKLTITDAADQSYTLYAAIESGDLNMFNLPPVPPAGIFDVRYGSQRYVEDLSQSQSINLNGVVYPVTITAQEIAVVLQDAVDGSLFNVKLQPGESYTIDNNNISMLKVGTDNITPVAYTLEQNYPNPFNPSTTIKFSLPEAGSVKLSVYNALGQKVADLVNSTLESGNHSINWDAANLSSGIYFYKLEAGKFNEVRKMMLIK